MIITAFILCLGCFSFLKERLVDNVNMYIELNFKQRYDSHRSAVCVKLEISTLSALGSRSGKSFGSGGSSQCLVMVFRLWNTRHEDTERKIQREKGKEGETRRTGLSDTSHRLLTWGWDFHVHRGWGCSGKQQVSDWQSSLSHSNDLNRNWSLLYQTKKRKSMKKYENIFTTWVSSKTQ